MGKKLDGDSRSTETAMKCQWICTKKEQCNFFTWKKQEKDCILLKDKEEENSTPDNNSISGPKTCDNDGKRIFF